MSFGVPIFILLIFAIASGRRQSGTPDVDSTQSEAVIKTQGYIDQSGLIKAIPEDLPDDQLRAFQTEDQALDAIESGEIEGYYIIPRTYE
jgi:hypothetical protein